MHKRTGLVFFTCFGLSLWACTNAQDVKKKDQRPDTNVNPEAAPSDAGAQPVDANAESKDPEQAEEPVAFPSSPTSLEAGSLQVSWIHGSADCSQNTNPPIQIHMYNKNTMILRQNKCLNFEAPFIYLLFGETKALLLDTGATASNVTFPIRQTVENLMNDHYGAAARSSIQLVVAHSHGHGDHRAADAQFTNQAATTLIGPTQSAVAAFFNISAWPNQIVDFDLGGRLLQIVPIPGHEPSHIAVFDARTGLLLAGDSVYPGRLYIQDWTQFRASISRLKEFAGQKKLSFILGAHIEMSKTAGVDYPAGSTFQPDEHALELTMDKLVLLDNELKAIGPQPIRKVLADFIISP